MTGDTDPPEWDSISINGARLSREGLSRDLTLTIHVTANNLGNEETKLEPVAYVTQPDYAEIELWWNRTNALFAATNPFTVSYPINHDMAIRGIDLKSGTQVLRLDFPV